MANGATVYGDGKWLYSFHATDPASRTLCNSFDLVRIHKFGHLDDDYMDAKGATRPSYKEMEKFALADKKVSKLYRRLLFGTPQENFGDVDKISDSENWKDKLEITTTGNLCKSANNVMLILENDADLKDKLIFDRFTDRFLIKGFLPWDYTKLQEIRTWTDEDEDCLVNYIEKNYRGIRVPIIIKSCLSELKLKKSINMVTEYFESLKWDGMPRIDTLLIDYFGTEDTIYSREIIRKELVAAVRRVITEKAVKFDQMIIITGIQGIGKSTFLNKLGKKWYTDFKLKLDDKDTLVGLQKYMIVEVGELAGFNKVEVSALKNFISQTTDTYRAPYARNTVEHPRHYVLFGTTNDDEFLKDSTGERRFWPIECGVQATKKSVFDDLTEEEVDQIWAEAVYLNNKRRKFGVK